MISVCSGWHMTATYYRDQIAELTAKMFSILPQILPANRSHVDAYLHRLWSRITELTSSLVGNKQTEALEARFQGYVDFEEERLRERLETVRYAIDGMDTLSLVTGAGRIEKVAASHPSTRGSALTCYLQCVYPLLYLLLCRDFEIFRLARTNIIHKDELWDSADTIDWLLVAVEYRHNDVESEWS